MILENPGTPCFDECAAWRDDIELRLDDVSPPESAGAIERHLASCADCRAYEAALAEIGRGLRDLPGASSDVPPVDVLEAVWAVTIGAGVRTTELPRGERRVGCGGDRRVTKGGSRTASIAPVRRASVWAAAAVLALAASAAFVLHRGSDPGPAVYTEADLARLDRDLQTALVTIGRTFHRAERFAVNEALIGETSPALRRLPLSPENQ